MKRILQEVLLEVFDNPLGALALAVVYLVGIGCCVYVTILTRCGQ